MLDEDFLVIKDKPTHTQESASTLRDLSKQEDGVLQQLQVYVGHKDQKGCK